MDRRDRHPNKCRAYPSGSERQRRSCS